MRKIPIVTGFIILIGLLSYLPVNAQNLTIHGIVRDANTNDPLPGVNVVIKGTTLGTSSSADGTFELKNLEPGNYTVVFSFIGYKTRSEKVALTAGSSSRLIIDLTPSSVELNGIQISALRPDMQGTVRMQEQQVREDNPTDAGGLLRNITGVNAVRRGPVGLDPVVRGLRGDEVGIYVDGSRSSASCPTRMDTPLSHFDPTDISEIKVVKGPYALTWGAGNMSAIWVKTKSLTGLADNTVQAHITSGYQSNSNELSEIGSVTGKQSGIGFLIHGALRKQGNYDAGGAGESVPAQFSTRELQGKVGIPIQKNGSLTASLGFQNQGKTDYPGRLLTARYFNEYNSELDYEFDPVGHVLQSVTAQVYANHIDHAMNNDGKPTALPDPNRMPPFAINVVATTHSTVIGGRANATLNLGNTWNMEIGGDSYTAYKKANRTVSRKDNGMVMFSDLIWPNGVLTDAGLFVRMKRNIGERLQATGTVRYDYVYANADTASDFFRTNVSDQLKSTKGMLNGAVTVNYTLNSAWSVGFGYGSVARTPSITERYSDRFPSTKAQTSAEFVGNPALKPERNNQVDLYLQANYNNVSWSFDGFVRSMHNYITINPTNLPKRLPLSPRTVYQYVNGQAVFHGFESSLVVRPIIPLQLRGSISYLWGDNRSLSEPAIGISPFQLDTGVRYTFQNTPLYLDGTVHFVGTQDRVATLLGETTTNGHVTADLRSGFTLWTRIMVETGVTNLTNVYYVDHLNSKNPFTGQPIPEPGRVLYINVSLTL